jgi:repressor LexA
VTDWRDTPTDDTSLTARQRAVLDFIPAYTAEHGYPPTVREIGEAVGLNSSASVQELLGVLVTKGPIRRTTGANRGIVVVGTQPVDQDLRDAAALVTDAALRTARPWKRERLDAIATELRYLAGDVQAGQEAS